MKGVQDSMEAFLDTLSRRTRLGADLIDMSVALFFGEFIVR